MSRSRIGRLAAATGALIALSLAVAAPAWAVLDNSTVNLNSGQKNKIATDFEKSCAQVPGGAVAGKDGWVFVLPDNKNEFVSLHLTFFNGTNNVTVDIPGSSYPNGIVTNGADKAYVILPAGWKLVDGTAVVTGGDFFNVTHTCVYSTTPPTTRTTTPATPSTSASTPGLPVTGTALGGLIVTSLALIAGGAVLLVLRRRRDSVQFKA
jgi:hypothetical protein